MLEEDEKFKKAPTALMSKQLSNCEWEIEIEDAEGEFDEALMAEIEVSERTAESESECALKTENKGKGKAAADDDIETFSDSESEVTYTRKIKALLKDNVTFKEYLDKKDVLIKDLSDKPIAYETDLIKERVLITKWKMERNVLDECVNKQRKVYIKDGLDVKTGCGEDEVEIDGVKSFSTFNKQCTREFIRDCMQYLDFKCDLKKYVNACDNHDLETCYEFDISNVSTCSTNSVCDASDCVSEVSSTSTFFDKVVHTAREYIPIHKNSFLAEDVILDKFGNPLIQYYDLSHEKPKKNDFIAPENHILMSDQESKRFVQVKINAPINFQSEIKVSNKVSIKGKSVDVKDKFIDLKDKPAQSKGKNCKHKSSESNFKGYKEISKGHVNKKASENDKVSESGVIRCYSRDYMLSMDHSEFYSNACRDYMLPKFVDKGVEICEEN
ncbi:hypothetical protein L1987_20783 [Smallanthus sonchifolius]|uniref:Uncharacterized protein n=1 Tax=Smallanthus sonchifolius TaxID=185202 RepID=A0ACB9IT99_9ASTR|nr:hypothetical protein L1987_20783 [Smallanthus sonchifolius]